MFHIVVKNVNCDMTVFQSEPMKKEDVMDAMSVMMKVSVFGVPGFQIVVEAE